MTQEDKELLLKDLSGRLPYGVIVEITTDGGMMEASYNMKLDTEILSGIINDEYEIKPYLRSMSSMTEEEKDVYNHRNECLFYDGRFDDAFAVDWLNENMFDYRGLIPKGLAIEINKDNNPYKD